MNELIKEINFEFWRRLRNLNEQLRTNNFQEFVDIVKNQYGIELYLVEECKISDEYTIVDQDKYLLFLLST